MSTIASWLTQAETWLDDRDKPAWIVAMIPGFDPWLRAVLADWPGHSVLHDPEQADMRGNLRARQRRQR